MIPGQRLLVRLFWRTEPDVEPSLTPARDPKAVIPIHGKRLAPSKQHGLGLPLETDSDLSSMVASRRAVVLRVKRLEERANPQRLDGLANEGALE